MPRIQRDAILISYRRIELALHVVDGLRDEIETEFTVGVEIIKEACH